MIRPTLWVIATALLTAAAPPATTSLDIQSVELWTGNEAGKDWRRVPGARFGSNGRFLMTFMRFPGARGIIGRSVCLTSDDPLGAYKIVVSHGKPVIGRVHFILLDCPLERTDVTIPVAEAYAIRAMLER